MNCAKARFLLYAYLDRDMSSQEADALQRHLAGCSSCRTRSRSAHGLAQLLHSRVDRTPAPSRLRTRLQQGPPFSAAHARVPLYGFAAVLLVLIVPLAADKPLPRSDAALTRSAIPSISSAHRSTGFQLVSRQMTGTLVCLTCESRIEAGLCPLPESHHQAGLCADNGEVWRLMSRDSAFTQASVGQTVTLEGVTFPQSGFLRASRVGY
jgi:anti-sigma factor (TIGR02949 family)